MTSTEEVRRWFATFIAKSGGSDRDSIVAAFAAIPREDYLGPGPWSIFVGPGYLTSVDCDPRCIYQDVLVGLVPAKGINNGQPSLHARCLDAADPQPGEHVVHVGAGTGYYTAILATMVGTDGRVTAFELEDELAQRARGNLQGFAHVDVVTASATDRPLPACEVIYVNAGASYPPPGWLDALSIGGRLVFPLTGSDGQGVMLKVTRRSESAYDACAFARVAFIPCIGARDDDDATAVTDALKRNSQLQDVRSLRRDSAPDGTAWCVGRGWWLSMEPST